MNTQNLINLVNRWPDGPNISPFTPYVTRTDVVLAQYDHQQDTLECDPNAHPWLFLHELAHAIGSRWRLARYDPVQSEHDLRYAHEEVIAAETATELCAQLSLPLNGFQPFVEFYGVIWFDHAPPIRYNEVDESVDYILRRFKHAL